MLCPHELNFCPVIRSNLAPLMQTINTQTLMAEYSRYNFTKLKYF